MATLLDDLYTPFAPAPEADFLGAAEREVSATNDFLSRNAFASEAQNLRRDPTQFDPLFGDRRQRGDILSSLTGARERRIASREQAFASILGDVSSGLGGGQLPQSPWATGSIFDEIAQDGSAAPVSLGGQGTSFVPLSTGDVDRDALALGIVETAQALGADPLELATLISYETAGTFNPTQAGPTTQWGQHRGLIQFGEPQAVQYGVDWNNPLGSQLGANGAIVRYFTANGWQPGMSGLDMYSIINAGGPGRYSASDAANGGAPGTVADKYYNQMGGHRQKAIALLSPYMG